MRFSRSASYLARTASGSKLERSSLTPTVEPPRSRAPRSRSRSGHVDAWRAMVEHQRRDGREVRRHQLVRASSVARFDRVGDLLVRRDHAGPEARLWNLAGVLGVVGPRLLVQRPQALERADDD